MSTRKPPRPDGETAEKAPARRPRPARPRPGDDPLVVVSAGYQIGYEYTFDAAGLRQVVGHGPTPGAAAAVFVTEVLAGMMEDSTRQIREVDPNFPATLVEVVLAIAAACPAAEVRTALETYRDRPKSLTARFTRVSLARRLPGHWLQDSLEVSRALIATGIDNLDTDLFPALFPFPTPSPDDSTADRGLPEPATAPGSEPIDGGSAPASPQQGG
jgi:hypothetical protein